MKNYFLTSILLLSTYGHANTNSIIRWENNNIPEEIKNEVELFYSKKCPTTFSRDILFVKEITTNESGSQTDYNISLSTLPLPDTSVHVNFNVFLYERGHERDVFTGISSFNSILECY